MSPESPTINPYAAPKAPPRGPADLTEPEKIRYELLSFETGFKSVGNFYQLGAVLSSLTAVIFLGVGFLGAKSPHGEENFSYLAGAIALLITIALVWLAQPLVRLDPKVGRLHLVCGILGLLAFPFGTMVNAYLIYLLLSPKGKRALSSDYKQVIAATPHIAYQSPYLLGVTMLVSVLGGIVAWVYFGSR